MIASPHTSIPVPDAVADFSQRQLPEPVRDAICWAAELGESYASDDLAGPRYSDIRMRLTQGIAAANKTLAAHNPHRMYRPGDLPGLRRKENR